MEHFYSLWYYKQRGKKKKNQYFSLNEKENHYLQQLLEELSLFPSLQIKEFHIPKCRSCLSCEWNKPKFYLPLFENTSLLAFSLLHYLWDSCFASLEHKKP